MMKEKRKVGQELGGINRSHGVLSYEISPKDRHA